MVVSSEFSNAIRRLMTQPCEEFGDDTLRLAQESGALAIGFDLCNDVFIRPDGAVGGASIDDSAVTFAEMSPSRLISALLFGSKRIPELHDLVPVRPDDAVNCSQCDASGKHPIAKHTWCDFCGGVGWMSNEHQF